MISTAWAAEAVKQMADTPIYMTYNFFLTAIGFPALALFLKYLLSKNDEKVREAVALKDALYNQSIESIRKSIDDWQQGARERTAGLCKKIDDLAQKKVDGHECDRIHRNLDDTLDQIKKRVWT